jgi:hypothetical protein
VRTFALVLLLCLGAGVPSAGAGEPAVYWTTPAMLKEFFRSSERVGYVKLRTAERAEDLRRLLGYVPSKPEYTVFVATTGGQVDGYAVIDEEQGQHQPITFGIKLTPAGVVDRVEVMVYREGYGDEIREERFRRQFVGRGEKDLPRFQSGVDAVTGATISSGSATVAVRRAVALVTLARTAATPEKSG